MHDEVLDIDGSTVQHGPNSDRVYLMKLGEAAVESLAPQLETLAAKHGYGKIFTKVPPDAADWLGAHGYVEEARIPGYHRRQRDVVFMSRFCDPERRATPMAGRIKEILERCPSEPRARRLPEGYRMRRATPEDTPSMAALYRDVFPSYPFPIHDSAYLLEMMNSNVRYFTVEERQRMVALASGEIDMHARAVEMTDFATLPSQRGKGLASSLLRAMERRLADDGILTAYTIARAQSEGMNRTFARGGYRFGGTLVNNTQIGGRIESMNVWHKSIAGKNQTY